jgi:hypothetical protein
MGTGSGLGEIFASTSDLSGLIRFSPSCVETYQELFMPGRSIEAVKSSIYQRLIGEGRFMATTPDWLEEAEGAVGYAVIDDRVALRIQSDQMQSAPFIAVGIAVRQEQ